MTQTTQTIPTRIVPRHVLQMTTDELIKALVATTVQDRSEPTEDIRHELRVRGVL